MRVVSRNELHEGGVPECSIDGVQSNVLPDRRRCIDNFFDRFNFSSVPLQMGTNLITVTVVDSQGATGSDTVIITRINTTECDIGVTTSVSVDPVSTKERFVYSVVARNNGNAPCDGVTVIDKLPKGVSDIVPLTFVSVGRCKVGGRTVTCGFGTIEPGDSVQVSIQVDAPTTVGPITNQAKAEQTAPTSR